MSGAGPKSTRWNQAHLRLLRPFQKGCRPRDKGEAEDSLISSLYRWSWEQQTPLSLSQAQACLGSRRGWQGSPDRGYLQICQSKYQHLLLQQQLRHGGSLSPGYIFIYLGLRGASPLLLAGLQPLVVQGDLFQEQLWFPSCGKAELTPSVRGLMGALSER